jgi:hypothetical protein
MAKNILLKITIALYMGMLILPTVQMRFNLFDYKALDEARQRAPEPIVSVDRSANDFKGLVNDFETWFNDNYGFRDLLISLGTQIDYSIFRYSGKIHIGRDGFLYYRFVSDYDLFWTYLAYKENKVHDAYNRLMSISDKIKKKGIRMVFIMSPLKPALYPEFLPKSAPFKEDLCYRDLNELLKNQTEIIYIDVQERLFALKERMPVFYRTDFHWTSPAAFLIAEEIVNAMGKAANMGERVWKHPLEIEHAVFSGGEARFMPLFIVPQENSIVVKKNWTENGTFDYTQKELYEFIYHSQGKESVLPTTVFLGNSFGDGFTDSGMYSYFKNYYRANTWYARLDTILDNLPEGTKFFILQTIETVIPCLAMDECNTLSP